LTNGKISAISYLSDYADNLDNGIWEVFMVIATKEKSIAKGSSGKRMGCCAVEAIITVDERGQMVLPKELREKAGIKAGDKLAVTSWEKDGEVCCIALIKAGSLERMVKGMLSPVMKEML
jgi:AbrB family looped-hinge helix DNA binding protein